MTGPLVVVGDVLLDRDVFGTVSRLCPDAPAPVFDEQRTLARPGGAGLAALLAACDGREVVLVAALAADSAGDELRRLLEPRVRLVAVPDGAPTREKIRLRAGGTSLARWDRGGPGAPRTEGLAGLLREILGQASAVLVSDYAGGMAADPVVRDALSRLPSRVPVVWDPHPRGAEPLPCLTLVTPNEAEAATFAPEAGRTARGLAAVEQRAEALARRWDARAVCVTLGARGALLWFGGGTPVVVPAPAVSSGDACGAGDRFAATAAGLLGRGALLSEAVYGAVAAAADFLAAGGVAGAGSAAPPEVAGVLAGASSDSAALDEGERLSPAERVVRGVRSAGGTVVATGGCFDLLHAGHVATLRAARALGDCLVVCLNSDESVRRLKGPTRPLVPVEDRARVLEALECVDAVVVFDEDTPERALAGLRPDVWAKGGDYAEETLPESALVRSWGGQPVVLPFLDGRSTSRLLTEAARRHSTSSGTALSGGRPSSAASSDPAEEDENAPRAGGQLSGARAARANSRERT